MATKKALTAEKPAASKSLANIDQELALNASTLAAQFTQSSGNKIKIEASGDFVLPDGTNLGNEVQFIVLDCGAHNKFYTTAFNRDNPAPPDCYAMGRDLNAMAPEEDSPTPQNPDCRTCPMNQFGSGPGGRSKACQNRRVAAVLVVDPNNEEAHNAIDAPIYVIDLSPTNLAAFDGAMKSATKSMGHFIKVIITAIGENAGTFAKVKWVDPIPNTHYAIHAGRRSECEDLLWRKPDFAGYEAKAAPTRGRAPARRNAPAARR